MANRKTIYRPSTQEERAAIRHEEQIEARDEEAREAKRVQPVLEWFSQSGALIIVWAGSEKGTFDVCIDEEQYEGCSITKAPEKYQEMGIPALVGRVALTDERLKVLRRSQRG